MLNDEVRSTGYLLYVFIHMTLLQRQNCRDNGCQRLEFEEELDYKEAWRNLGVHLEFSVS